MTSPPLRILLTGSTGQVGKALRQTLEPLGEILAPDRRTLDLGKPHEIRKFICESRPNLIVNAAAYTAVDRAETEPELAMAINGIAPRVLAEEACRLDAVLVHYSTDYVFDGTNSAAYTESDMPNPLNVYGKTKLTGEQAIQAVGGRHYILRTSWVYAREGANFLNTILRLAIEHPELRIVNDQVGAPTWAQCIADVTTQILTSRLNCTDQRFGLYHLTSTGQVSWFGFAQAILAGAEHKPGINLPRLIPINTEEYPLPARRPRNSRLNTSRLTTAFGIKLSPWQDMLTECLRGKLSDKALNPAY